MHLDHEFLGALHLRDAGVDAGGARFEGVHGAAPGLVPQDDLRRGPADVGLVLLERHQDLAALTQDSLKTMHSSSCELHRVA